MFVGAYYPRNRTTELLHYRVPDDAPACREELFGPVAALFRAPRHPLRVPHFAQHLAGTRACVQDERAAADLERAEPELRQRAQVERSRPEQRQQVVRIAPRKAVSRIQRRHRARSLSGDS